MLHHGKRLAIIHAMACACSFWFASGLLTCLESLLFALVHPPVRSPVAHAVRTTCTSAQALIGGPCPQSDTPQPALNVHLSESCGSLFELPTELTSSKHCSAWRIRLVVYGARLESVLCNSLTSSNLVSSAIRVLAFVKTLLLSAPTCIYAAVQICAQSCTFTVFAVAWHGTYSETTEFPQFSCHNSA